MRNQIDENLRRIYDIAREEEVPESLKLLLQQLRDSTASKGAIGPGHVNGATQLQPGTDGSGRSGVQNGVEGKT